MAFYSINFNVMALEVKDEIIVRFIAIQLYTSIIGFNGKHYYIYYSDDENCLIAGCGDVIDLFLIIILTSKTVLFRMEWKGSRSPSTDDDCQRIHVRLCNQETINMVT